MNSLKLDFKKNYNQLNGDYTIPSFLDKSYFPSLDGWRAVGIILVILGHAKLTIGQETLYYHFAETFIYADLGVQIFFVLSGFLITTLLIKEKLKTGSINIKHFFIKRVLRIFPVLYLYLIVVLLVNRIFNLGLTSDNFIGPLLYINNFSIFTGTWLTGHTWSLAVEEQFYLIWPFLLNYLRNKIWLFCLVMILIVPFLKVFLSFKSQYFDISLAPFIIHADSIFSGALLAMLAFKNYFNVKQKFWHIKGLNVIFITIIFVSYYCVNRGYVGFIFYPFSGTICNLFICLLLIQTLINTKNLLYKLLNLDLMVQIGLISYSLYIWQQLFLFPTAGYDSKMPSFTFPLSVICAFVVAYLSYYFFEKPFLKLKEKITIKQLPLS